MTFKPPVGTGNPFEEGSELRSFRAAWANRLNAPVNVVCMGDSITQGYWASSAEQRWFEVFLTRLMQNNGQQVPIGYVPLNENGLTSYTGRNWTKAAGLQDDREHFEGPTLTAMVLDPDNPGPTGDVSFTGTCDRIALFGTSYTSFTGGARINIDGGADIAMTFVGASDKGSRVWLSDALARGPHTIRVRSTVGSIFGPVIEGCVLFDGNGPTSAGSGTGLVTTANFQTGSGLRIYNFSHNGYTTASWTTTDSRPWYDCFDYVRPHLITVLLGCNDEFVGMSLSTYRTNLELLISQVRTASAALTPVLQPPSMVLIGMFGTGVTGAAAMPPYNEVMRQVAKKNGCAFVDWYDLAGFVGTEVADVYDLISSLDGPTDGKHPSDQGHQLLGDNLAMWLTNAIGPTGQIPRQPIRKITATGRQVTDGVLNGTTTLTSATASFQTTDVGKTISGIGIPIGTTISARASTTSITLSTAATLSASGVILSIADTQAPLKTFSDNKVIVDCSAVEQVLRLPSPIGQASQEFMIKKVDTTINRVRLYCPEGTIDGGTQYDMDTPMHSITVTSDGVSWWCI